MRWSLGEKKRLPLIDGVNRYCENGDEFQNNVLEAFVRRLPPRSRSDFSRYLQLRGLNPSSQISDFALLGYAGAKLPDDGFELVHPFDNAVAPFELIIEIAGFRYESGVNVEDVTLEGEVAFFPEPDHQHDNRAIRIEQNGKKLGYVDRGRTELIHSYLGADHQVAGEVVRKNGTAERPLVYVYTSIAPAMQPAAQGNL